MSKRVLNLTLAVIKPDVYSMPCKLSDLKTEIIANGFLVARAKELRWTVSDAEEFYQEHKGKFFYNRLVTFMSSGPMMACILAHEDAIGHWRKLMGPTKVYKTQYEAPETIRGRYGLTDTRNATHGSDSEESARREIVFFFKDFDWEQWYRQEEPFFRTGKVKFDPDSFVHSIER